MLKKVKLFFNDNAKSKEIKEIVLKKLIDNGFEIVDSGFELAIAIGGDGSFLRMIKECKFNDKPLYVGINAGTLGFAQEVEIDDIDSFIEDLKSDNYKVDDIGIQENKVISNDKEYNFYSLNEIVIRERELNVANLNISVDDVFLEQFVGDGILIATSFGTTAYNLSFGGSIIFNTFHSLQITPIAPLHNKVFKSLVNSIVIPEKKIIKIVPDNDKKNLLLSIDGDNVIYDNVSLITTCIGKKKIKCLRKKDYDFFKKVNEKFLK